MKYETVIEKIGGGNISEAARKLRMPYATVAQWKRSGKVPHWREAHVRAVAERLGVKLEDRVTA